MPSGIPGAIPGTIPGGMGGGIGSFGFGNSAMMGGGGIDFIGKGGPPSN